MLCAVGMFIYQTLDALDGKQARRTGTNNPLGELFDHGSDAISTMVIGISTASVLAMSEMPYLMLGFIMCLAMLFYLHLWDIYVTGTLHFLRCINN